MLSDLLTGEQPVSTSPLPTDLAAGYVRLGQVSRSLQVKRGAIDEQKRTVELSWSSEEPVLQWFGWETLDHSAGAVRLERLAQMGPLLVEHSRGNHIGTVERVWIGNDRRGHALVRFSSSDQAEEKFQDVVDGILRGVSTYYSIHKMIPEPTLADGQPRFRVIDWEPQHITLTAEPADITVGIGRSQPQGNIATQVVIQPPASAERTSGEANTHSDSAVAKAAVTQREEAMLEVLAPPAAPASPAAPAAEITVRETRQAEIERIRAIETLASRFQGRVLDVAVIAREAVEAGRSVADFQKMLLEKMGDQKPGAVVAEQRTLGLGEKDTKRFSVMRAINAIANPSDRGAREAAAHEFEVSRAVSATIGKDPQGLWVPQEVMRAPMRYGAAQLDRATYQAMLSAQRDLLASTAAAGQETVATVVMSMIEFMENRSVAMQLATKFRDSQGNLSFPRQLTSPVATYGATETTALAELSPTFESLVLSPKILGAPVDLSARLTKQSSIDAEAFVRQFLGTKLGLGIDLASISGSGAGGNPRGILNTTGVGTVTITGGNPTWANIVEFETDVADKNGDMGTLAYLTNARVRGKLKSTEKTATTGIFLWAGAEMNGYPALVSNQIPGTPATADNVMIFGNWEDLYIAFWGPMDLIVDPYTKAASNLIVVTARQENDVGVAHGGSFSFANTINA